MVGVNPGFITVDIFLGGYCFTLLWPSLYGYDNAEWRRYKSRKVIGGVSSGAVIPGRAAVLTRLLARTLLRSRRKNSLNLPDRAEGGGENIVSFLFFYC